jgi:hypothetical protein
MKPMFSRVQYSSTSSKFLSTRLYRFCTETIGVIRLTASICLHSLQTIQYGGSCPRAEDSTNAPI